MSDLTNKPKPHYGPVYAAALYPEWAAIARAHGYALAVHGSLARDCDLIAIPWTEDAAEPQAVIEAIKAKFAVREVGGPPSEKPHGRLAYTLSIGFGECAADLQFVPRLERVGGFIVPGWGKVRPEHEADPDVVTLYRRVR